MSNTKVFKSLDEQVEILKSKGLEIPDIDAAKEILLRENYFFLSGYRHLFMRSNSDKEFIRGARFDELYAIFKFDRKVRNILFKHILIIENNMKSIISYQLSKKYGFRENDYLNPKHFIQDNLKKRQVHDVLNKMKRQIRVNGKQHTATLHYINNYGYVPMWILVKVLSFGILGELYDILSEEDSRTIADMYKLSPDTLSVSLSILSNFRNLCAHEDILYDHRTQEKIPDSNFHEQLHLPMTDDEYTFGKNDLFAVLIIFKQMLTPDELQEVIFELGYEIDLMDGIVSSVPLNLILNKMGFPDNWRDLEDLK